MPKLDFVFYLFQADTIALFFIYLLGAAEPLWSSRLSRYTYGNHGRSS